MKTLSILIKISVFFVFFATSMDAANAKTEQEIPVISTGLTYETGQYTRQPGVQVIFVSPACYVKGVDSIKELHEISRTNNCYFEQNITKGTSLNDLLKIKRFKGYGLTPKAWLELNGLDASLGGAAVFPSGSMVFKRTKVKK